VVAVLEDADATGPIDAATDDPRPRLRNFLDRNLTIDDLKRPLVGELEASDRCDVAEGLMFSVVVVVGHPLVQCCLCLLDGPEAPLGKELLAHRLVEALDLAGRRRRVGGGEDVLDAVVHTDAVEGHGGRLMGEPSGKHLAVVGEDLFRHSVAGQAADERVAHRARGRSSNDRGDDAEPRVIVYAGEDRQLGAVAKVDAAHDIELPQLHRTRPLPALVVVAPAPAGLGSMRR
jgi:hypothetical protein